MAEMISPNTTIKTPQTMSELERQLAGYRLTTAEILYHMPDFDDLLQTFIWQDLDLAPKYPVLNGFLDFWEAELDGKLHSVQVASKAVVQACEFRNTSAYITMQ